MWIKEIEAERERENAAFDAQINEIDRDPRRSAMNVELNREILNRELDRYEQQIGELKQYIRILEDRW